jgi:hypothetical protein
MRADPLEQPSKIVRRQIRERTGIEGPLDHRSIDLSDRRRVKRPLPDIVLDPRWHRPL